MAGLPRIARPPLLNAATGAATARTERRNIIVVLSMAVVCFLGFIAAVVLYGLLKNHQKIPRDAVFFFLCKIR